LFGVELISSQLGVNRSKYRSVDFKVTRGDQWSLMFKRLEVMIDL